MKTQSFGFRLYAFFYSFIIVVVLVQTVCAQNAIQYLSSSTGFVLHRSGSKAVVAQWQAQQPIANFTGYGKITMDNLCLTGNTGKSSLTWETCRNDPGQTWSFVNGRLRNERGWCADLEGGRTGANVPVLAWNCSGASNQTWRAHYAVAASGYLSNIKDANTRNALNNKLSNASSGQIIRISAVEKKALEDAGASGLIGLDGATLISAGGMNLISAGGMNFRRN